MNLSTESLKLSSGMTGFAMVLSIGGTVLGCNFAGVFTATLAGLWIGQLLFQILEVVYDYSAQ